MRTELYRAGVKVAEGNADRIIPCRVKVFVGTADRIVP
jgi:hypothetical protein